MTLGLSDATVACDDSLDLVRCCAERAAVRDVRLANMDVAKVWTVPIIPNVNVNLVKTRLTAHGLELGQLQLTHR